MSQQSISRCRVCETPYNLCSPFINPPPPCYYPRTIPYSLLNPCLQEWCHKEHHSAALHIPQTLTPRLTPRVFSSPLMCAHAYRTYMNEQTRTGPLDKPVDGLMSPDVCLLRLNLTFVRKRTLTIPPSARHPVDTSQQQTKKRQKRAVLRTPVLAVWRKHLWERWSLIWCFFPVN